MFDGIMNAMGSFIPDEKKAKAVYGAIDKILIYQSKKFNVPINILTANITKPNGALIVDIWKLNEAGSYDHLWEVSKKELINILSNE